MSVTNTAEVFFSDGRVVCLSYGVPVAAYIPPDYAENPLPRDCVALVEHPGPWSGYLKTDVRYSVTSARHANAFCGGGPEAGTVVPDAVLRALIAPVTGKRED